MKLTSNRLGLRFDMEKDCLECCRIASLKTIKMIEEDGGQNKNIYAEYRCDEGHVHMSFVEKIIYNEDNLEKTDIDPIKFLRDRYFINKRAKEGSAGLMSVFGEDYISMSDTLQEVFAGFGYKLSLSKINEENK